MLRILGNKQRLCDGITRREMLRAGGLGIGLSLADLLQSDEVRAAQSGRNRIGSFGKAKNCIVLFLYGAWSQLDTFDMKPDAPREIRGEFQPISTSVPGLQICEHLPRIARSMDRVTLVRSLTHPHPTHCVAYALSGIPENPLADPRAYWPFYSSTIDYLWEQDARQAQAPGMPRQMCLPFELNSHSGNKSHRGLTAAWLGREWEPVFAEFVGKATREKGFPSADGEMATFSRYDPFDGIAPDGTFRSAGLELPAGVTLNRLSRRRSLLEQFNAVRKELDKDPSTKSLNRFQQLALEMVASPKCLTAMDVTQEPTKVREKYGYTLFGQSALAARRLVESGVRVVTVYWDEYGPANTAWDTHVNNFPRLKVGLCPTLDQVYTTLLDDLEERGMLEDTVVLLMSEHGRTPKIGDKPGGAREHWSYAYCGVFAGAGIPHGRVIGGTDRHAGYAEDRPLNPKDILATLYHLLGIDPETTRTYDRFGRPHFLLPYGQIVPELLT